MAEIGRYKNSLHSVVTGSANILDDNATNDARNKRSGNQVAVYGRQFAELKQKNIERDFVNESMNNFKQELADESVRITLDPNIGGLEKTDALMQFYDKRSVKLLNSSPTDRSNLELKGKFNDLKSRTYASHLEANTNRYITNRRKDIDLDLNNLVDDLGNFGDYKSLDEKIKNSHDLIEENKELGIYSNEEAADKKEQITAELTDSIIDYYYGTNDLKSAKFVLNKDGVKNLHEKTVLKWRLALKRRKTENVKKRISLDVSELNFAASGTLPSKPSSMSVAINNAVNSLSNGNPLQKSIGQALRYSRAGFLKIISDQTLNLGQLKESLFRNFDQIKNNSGLSNSGKDAVLKLYRGYINGIDYNIKEGNMKAIYGSQVAERLNPGDPRNIFTKTEARAAYQGLLSGKKSLTGTEFEALAAHGITTMAALKARVKGEPVGILKTGYAADLNAALKGQVDKKDLKALDDMFANAPAKYLKSKGGWFGNSQDKMNIRSRQVFSRHFALEVSKESHRTDARGEEVRVWLQNREGYNKEITQMLTDAGDRAYNKMSVISVGKNIVAVSKIAGYTNGELSKIVSDKMGAIVSSDIKAVGYSPEQFDSKAGNLRLGTTNGGQFYFYLPNPNGESKQIQIEGLNMRFDIEALKGLETPDKLRSTNANSYQTRDIASDILGVRYPELETTIGPNRPSALERQQEEDVKLVNDLLNKKKERPLERKAVDKPKRERPLERKKRTEPRRKRPLER